MKVLAAVVGTICVLLVAGAPSALADVIPVELMLVPPSGGANTLELTLAAALTASGSTRSDTDTATFTGNVLAELTIDFDPVTLEADTVGLEFTGGRFAASDVSFTLDFSILIGSIHAAGAGIAGTLDTPVPPGPVAGGVFPGGDHVAIFNDGGVDVSGTGLVAVLYDPFTINLADHTVVTATEEPGSLLVSAPTIVGDLATFDVTLTQPVAISQQIYNEGGLVVTLTGAGTFQAAGQFVIPEPAALLLLASGGLVLARRRRL